MKNITKTGCILIGLAVGLGIGTVIGCQLKDKLLPKK